MRHIIRFSDRENLINTIKDVVNAGVVKAIHCTLLILGFI